MLSLFLPRLLLLLVLVNTLCGNAFDFARRKEDTRELSPVAAAGVKAGGELVYLKPPFGVVPVVDMGSSPPEGRPVLALRVTFQTREASVGI